MLIGVPVLASSGAVFGSGKLHPSVSPLLLDGLDAGAAERGTPSSGSADRLALGRAVPDAARTVVGPAVDTILLVSEMGGKDPSRVPAIAPPFGVTVA